MFRMLVIRVIEDAVADELNVVKRPDFVEAGIPPNDIFGANRTGKENPVIVIPKFPKGSADCRGFFGDSYGIEAIARFDDVVTVWLSGLMEFDDNGVLASAQRGDLSVFAIGNEGSAIDVYR